MKKVTDQIDFTFKYVSHFFLVLFINVFQIAKLAIESSIKTKK